MNENKKKIDELIANSTKALITAHMGPDDDAIASILAMDLYIKKHHPKTESIIALSGKKLDKWDFLPEAKNIKWVEDIADIMQNVDLLILQDGTPLKRFTEKENEIDLSKLTILCIDHHVYEGDGYNLTIRDTSASSNTQILAETLFSDDDIKDRRLGEILLIGIYGDTGNMTFVSPETSRAYTAAKRIVDLGNIEVQVLLNRKKQFKLAEFELIKELMKNTKSLDLGNGTPKLLYSYYSHETAKKYDRDTLSSLKRKFSHMILRRVEDYPWGFVVTPQEKEFSISFRSTPGAPNVQKIASEKFTGGGHTMAAGGQLPRKEGETIENFIEKVVKILKEEKLELVPTTTN